MTAFMYQRMVLSGASAKTVTGTWSPIKRPILNHCPFVILALKEDPTLDVSVALGDDYF